MSPPVILTREVPIGALVRWLRNRPVLVALGLGVLLRVVEYFGNRAYWMDEGSLVGCIAGLGRTGLFGPLDSTQLAPPGFLLAERAATGLLRTSRLAYRLVPLLAGVAALVLFRGVARRCLTPRGEFLAVLLFAVTDDLIYFSAEVKQYSSDLALTLLILLRADRATDGERDTGGAARPDEIGLGLLGIIAPWCSHPSVFTLAGVGILGLAAAVRDRDPRRIGAWCRIGLAWLGSIAAVHAVAMRQLGHRRDMWAFWEFAFPTWPVASAWDALWPVRRVLFLFASPLNFDAPFGPRWSILPAVAVALVGAVHLGRQRPRRFAALALPGGLALLAAYLRLYPFHGRLLLFAAPLLLVPIAAGLDVIGPRWLRAALVALVVGFPCLAAAGHLVEPRGRDANPYGDRRPPTLNPFWYPLAAPREWPLSRPR